MDSKYEVCNVKEDEFKPQGYSSLKSALFQYFGLLNICLITFGSYFCYENPAALQDKFETDMKLPASDFILLYSVYSWSNVILCFIGGFLVDRVFGIRWGTIIYVALSLCGQLIFAYGTYVNVFWLMVLGRFIFGSGAESLIVAQTAYIVLWFKGQSLNTLFGLQLSVSKMGSTVNTLSLENIYTVVSKSLNYTGPKCIGIVLFVAATTLVGSLICALLVGYMDRYAARVLQLKKNEGKRSELVKITDVKDFNVTFWMIVLVILAYYVAVFPFTSLGKLYFMTKYEFEADRANTVVSLIHVISAFTSPLFGMLIDKTGKNILWVILSIVGSLLAHGLLAFTYVDPYVGMAILGLSYSLLASSLWPMIALVIPEHQLGMGFGITQALLSLNLAVMSIICGVIVDNYGYFSLELFFLAWLLISLVPAVWIWLSDSKSVGETT